MTLNNLLRAEKQDAEVTMKYSENVRERITFLLDSKDVQADWDFLVTLQKEQAPWLSQDEAEDCVIYSLVKHYRDYPLSWMWYNETESFSHQQAA